MGDYTLVAANGVTIGAVMRLSSAAAASWRYYIGVEDIDAAFKAVAAGGGTVIDGPHEIPGGEFSLHGRDPQGAEFGLVGPRKG
jgi:predicted enzyme related to lactoylglutathione lyase